MGAVWKARDTKLDRDVALKILPEELSRDPETLSRFADEAKAVAALNHPNIVTIHSVEESGGVHFLTMELVQGKTLRDQIPPGGEGIDRILELALPITDAIGAAHQRGVTHRDLKPSNVMIGDDGRVKVLDFGLAHIRGRESDNDPTLTKTLETPTLTLTTESRVRGTMPYMSPEQVQGKPLDQRSDIFSLGVMLYELATGSRPFVGESSADVIAAILRDQPKPPSEMNRSLPHQFDRTVNHALEKTRDKRFQTVQDLHDELAGLKQELESGTPYEVRRPTPEPAGPSTRKSIAVLPLVNLSGDSEQEFFADGMTDALITDLAKIGNLKVISRTSIMRYKGTDKPMRDVARELGVDAVIEGSILRGGDRVRINAQLIDAATDEHLWAESYERELSDVLALQSDVAQAIAKKIEVQLTDQEQARLASPRTVNPEAHEAYLKGRHFWYKRSAEAVKKGLEYFERAAELDPAYAPAYAGIADSYLVDLGGYLGVEPGAAYDEARASALKALELDDDLAEGHTSLAAVMTDFEWQWDGAQREYERAIELNPSSVTAHYWLADHLSRMGRHDEAIARVDAALDIDPLSPTGTFFGAWVRFYARRYDDAIEMARKALELESNYMPAWRILGWAHEERAQYDEAIEAHQRAAAISKGSSNFAAQLGRAYALAGRTDEAQQVLDDLKRRATNEPVSSHDVAVLYAALGDHEQAFEWLGRACDEHSEHVPYAGVNPRLDALRSDARFAAVLERLNLSE
jgi:serine/threonine protein kinase/tetratricopeptide (TPR) repeat protein